MLNYFFVFKFKLFFIFESMGIVNLYKFIEQYLKENHNNQRPIKSDICYIDCTSKIYSYLNDYYRNEKKQSIIQTKNNIYLIIDNILTNIASNFIKQITENRYYNKFILVFDYKYPSDSKKLYFDDDLLTYYENYPDLTQFDKKERISAIPLIPRSVDILNTDMNDLYLMTANAFNKRWSYWHFKTKNIDNYINVEYLIQNLKTNYTNKYKSDIESDLNGSNFEKERENDLIVYSKLSNLKRYNFQSYLIQRGLKRFGLKHKRYPHYDDLKKSYMSNESDEIFSEKFKKQIFNVTPQLIIELVPNLVFKIKEGVKNVNKTVDFLACEEEADYVIYQHIKKYNYSNQCPTINTNDSDMVLLLHDVDCIIKIKKKKFNNQYKKNQNNCNLTLNNSANNYQRNRHCDNLIIRPIEFWKWLTNKYENKFKNLLMLSVCLGTTYNNVRTKFKIDTIQQVREKYSDNMYENILNEIKYKLKTEDYKKNIGILQMFNAIEYYKHIDSLEESFHYIKPEKELIKKKIDQRYYELFTQLLLN